MLNTGIINYLKYFYPKLKTYAPFGLNDRDVYADY